MRGTPNIGIFKIKHITAQFGKKKNQKTILNVDFWELSCLSQIVNSSITEYQNLATIIHIAIVRRQNLTNLKHF